MKVFRVIGKDKREALTKAHNIYGKDGFFIISAEDKEIKFFLGFLKKQIFELKVVRANI